MKAFAPAADRNKDPILDVLRRVLPPRGAVLEIASGSGQHVVWFAAALPSLSFRPSDASAEARASIDAWVAESGLGNVALARALDVAEHGWEQEPVDAIVCINMIHISPWSATPGLFRGAARCLPLGAPLVLYGPFRFGGAFTSQSNAAFDASLKGRDPEWGVRDADAVEEVARAAGFWREETIAMPANNHVLVFRAGARPGS